MNVKKCEICKQKIYVGDWIYIPYDKKIGKIWKIEEMKNDKHTIRLHLTNMPFRDMWFASSNSWEVIDIKNTPIVAKNKKELLIQVTANIL